MCAHMNMQGSFEPMFVVKIGNISATRQKIKREGKRKEEESEWGEEVRQEKQYITGKYEIEFPVFTYHYK